MPFSRPSRPAKARPGTSSQSSSDEEPGSGPGFAALDRSRGFWTVIGYAVVFGLVLAVAALAFLAWSMAARSSDSRGRVVAAAAYVAMALGYDIEARAGGAR